MDIDLSVSVADTFRNAVHRIDGIAMYFTVCIFLASAILFGVSDLWGRISDTPKSTVVWGAIFMVLITPLFYVWLATFSAKRVFSRWLNASFLVAAPIYFFWKML